MTVIDPQGVSRKPGGVTLVQWLAYISGGLQILGGILFLTLRNDVEIRVHYSTTEVWIIAVVAIVIGLITWTVATSYARGSRLAMYLVGAVALLNLGSSIGYIFLHPAHVIAGLINIAISAVIFYLAVLAPSTRDYFERYGH